MKPFFFFFCKNVCWWTLYTTKRKSQMDCKAEHWLQHFYSLKTSTLDDKIASFLWLRCWIHIYYVWEDSKIENSLTFSLYHHLFAIKWWWNVFVVFHIVFASLYSYFLPKPKDRPVYSGFYVRIDVITAGKGEILRFELRPLWKRSCCSQRQHQHCQLNFLCLFLQVQSAGQAGARTGAGDLPIAGARAVQTVRVEVSLFCQWCGRGGLFAWYFKRRELSWGVVGDLVSLTEGRYKNELQECND